MKKVICLVGLVLARCFGGISINGNECFIVTSQQVKPFDEYVGDLPTQVDRLLQYIKDPSSFHKLGVVPSTALLLVGPPGSGKTSLVQAIVKSTGSILIHSIGSDFVDKFVGVGAQRVREVFEQAREAIKTNKGKKVFLFIDEIDAIGSRDHMREDDIESSRTVNALLAELEKANANPSLIVVGATNFVGRVDKALLRPGRFDSTIRIGLPNCAKRAAILKSYSKRYILSDDVNFDRLAELIEGFTPADIEFIVRDTGLRAIDLKLESVTFDCFVKAIEGMLQSLKSRGDEHAAVKLDALACLHGAPKGFKALSGEISSSIQEIYSYLKDPKTYEYYGIEPPKGVMVSGPHGSGKTAIVRALAQEAGCEFFYMSGTEFVDQYYGVGAKRMRALFERARAACESNPNGNVLIFIDDIDMIGSISNQGTEYQQTVAELLIQMDGFRSNESIIVFGATNKPEALSPALLSSGRFDVHIPLSLPDTKKRYDLISDFCKNKPLEPPKEELVEYVAAHTKGFDIAQIKALINNAARKALALKTKTITLAIFNQVIEEKNQHASQGRV